MRFLSLLLCPLMVLNPLWAQTNSTGSVASDLQGPLHVHVMDDPGPAQTQSTSAKGYAVQVTTSAGAPVVGAAVALRLPGEGPTGRFSNGLQAWVVYSDSAGVARFPVIQWGQQPGPAELRVTAAKGTSHTGLMIALQIGGEPSSMSVVSVPIESAAVVPKPAFPPAPEIALDMTTPDTISKPLADVVPPGVSPIDISKSGASARAGKPRNLTPNPPLAGNGDAAEPKFIMLKDGPHRSHKALWILLAVGAAAAAGTMIALNEHGSSTSSGSTSGVSVGTPTVTVGH